MYRLTPRMVQGLEQSLKTYHALFSGGRCSAWQLEELLVHAINSDTQAKHQARWTEGGHDDKADITVKVNGDLHHIQVKSGQIKSTKIKPDGKSVSTLVLSGHRLGRFEGNLNEITKYLNARDSNIISVPYEQIDDERGRTHKYHILYIDAEKLAKLKPSEWSQKSSAYQQINKFGVLVSVRPKMSWQVWWTIPADLAVREKREIII